MSRIIVAGGCVAIPQPDGSFVPPKDQAANRAAAHLAKSLSRYLLRGKELTDFYLPGQWNGRSCRSSLCRWYFCSGDTLRREINVTRSINSPFIRYDFQTTPTHGFRIFTISRLMITKRLKAFFKPAGI